MLSADDDFGESEPIRFFIASCKACGYTEFYRDGFLFKSDNEDTRHKSFSDLANQPNSKRTARRNLPKICSLAFIC